MTALLSQNLPRTCRVLAALATHPQGFQREIPQNKRANIQGSEVEMSRAEPSRARSPSEKEKPDAESGSRWGDVDAER